MNRSSVNIFLTALLLITVGRVVYVEWTPGLTDREGRVRGCDFQVFYIAGRMIADGEADRLYDHERLQEIQRTLAPVNDEHNPPYYLFYPPIAPLLVSPLGQLPYGQALIIWWCIQGVCFLLAGWMLLRDTTVDRRWRPAVWLALTAFYPVWDSVLHGQLSAILVLALVGGFYLQRRNRAVRAGLVLSLLAMKPQYLVGVMIWLAMRRDWRTLAATIAGACGQILATAAILGFEPLIAYAEYLPVCGSISMLFQFSPWAEHGAASILQNLLLPAGVSGGVAKTAAVVLQLFVAAAAGWMLFRLAHRRSNTNNYDHENLSTDDIALQQSGAVLFMLLLTPHVLTYDLVLLAVPLAYFLSAGRWGLAVGLYAAASILAIPLYNAIGFSLVPVVLLATLYVLSRKESASGMRL